MMRCVVIGRVRLQVQERRGGTERFVRGWIERHASGRLGLTEEAWRILHRLAWLDVSTGIALATMIERAEEVAAARDDEPVGAFP